MSHSQNLNTSEIVPWHICQGQVTIFGHFTEDLGYCTTFTHCLYNTASKLSNSAYLTFKYSERYNKPSIQQRQAEHNPNPSVLVWYFITGL